MSYNIIHSEIFKAKRGKIALILLERYGQKWLLAAFILFATAVFLGFALDYRIFVVALMILFLLAPALLMILYFNYGLKGMNFLNVLEHKIEVDHEKITLALKLSCADSQEEKGAIEEKGDEERGERGENMDRKRSEVGEEIVESGKGSEEDWRIYQFPFSDFGGYTVGKDYVLFPFLPPKEGFIYLPSSAFASFELFTETINRIAHEDNKR